MTEKISNIAKNTSYFTLALIVQKVISFTYFTLIARALGPENLGKYYFAISFTSIFSIFIDFGLGNVLMREVAKYKEKSKELLGSVLAIKIPAAIIIYTLAVIMVNLLGYPELVRDLVYLSAICMVFDSFSLTFFSVIRGHHNLTFESISSIIFQLIVLAFGLTMLKLGMSLRWLMGALVAASTFNLIYSSVLITLKWKIKLIPKFNYNLISSLIKITIPFGMFVMFQKTYLYLDSVFLSLLAGDKYVGLYQVAFKMIFALQFLPLAFVASLYPAMSSYWLNNKEQLSTTFVRSINYLIIISLPISVGIITLSDKIVLIFKSSYNESILPLQITMVALVFIFINYPIGALLNACEKQKINTINMGVSLLASITLNLLLIPYLKTTGASITVVVTNMLMFILGLYWVPKIIKIKASDILRIFIKSLIAVIIMGIATLYLKNILNIFFVIIISGILYFGILFILGGFKKQDILSIINSLTKKSKIA